jgi:hypothetical protein
MIAPDAASIASTVAAARGTAGCAPVRAAQRVGAGVVVGKDGGFHVAACMPATPFVELDQPALEVVACQPIMAAIAPPTIQLTRTAAESALQLAAPTRMNPSH